MLAEGINTKLTIREITELGIFVALAIVLDIPVFKFKIGPNGGSISFVLIPLFIIAIRHNWWKTLIAASIIYSPIACAIGGNGWQSFIFDYALSYGSIFLISLVRNKILSENKSSYIYLIISVLIFTLSRYIFTCISSMIFYSSNFTQALLYNVTYVPISSAIGLVTLLVLLKPLKIVNEKYPNINK